MYEEKGLDVDALDRYIEGHRLSNPEGLRAAVVEYATTSHPVLELLKRHGVCTSCFYKCLRTLSLNEP